MTSRTAGLYGPPEPVYLIPHPWGGHPYKIRRGAINKASDADDGRSWLHVALIAEPVLIGVSIKQLGKTMPTLPIDGRRAIDRSKA